MGGWRTAHVGLRHLPREGTAFKASVLYQCSARRRAIEEHRRPELRLMLALQVRFLLLRDCSLVAREIALSLRRRGKHVSRPVLGHTCTVDGHSATPG